MANHWPHIGAGMHTPDRIVWDRFLAEHEDTFADNYWYNVRISSENKPVPGLPPELQPMARRLRKKRIDVLSIGSTDPLTWPVNDFCVVKTIPSGWATPDIYATIIEVKSAAYVSVFSQVTYYPPLLFATFPDVMAYSLRVMIVADSLGNEVEWLCKFLGVPYMHV